MRHRIYTLSAHMKGEGDIITARDRITRTLYIVAGSALVAAFLAGVAYRTQAGQSLFGMDTVAGWVGHGAAILVLLGGLALLARGIFRRPEKSDAADRESFD